MRKITLFAVTALLLVACAKEEQSVTPVPEPSVDAVTILATAEAIPIASSDDYYTPQWHSGDQIIVDYNGKSYVYEAYDDGSTIEFGPAAMSLPTDLSGSLTAWFEAPGGIFSVDSDQSGNEPPMYSYTSSVTVSDGHINLTFKPLSSILALTIGEEPTKSVSSIVIEPLDEDGVTGCLAATEIIANATSGTSTISEDATLSNTVSMDLGVMSLASDQTVNLLIPTGTAIEGGLRITITCTDGTSYIKDVLEDELVQFNGNCVPAVTTIFFRLTVSSYEEMLSFAEECANNNGGAIVDLTADIDMQNKEWTPITGFTGTFNGNGYHIYNINISSESDYTGFFGYAQGAINDVVFGSKDGSTYDGSSKIEHKYAEGTSSWTYVGIIARSNSSITNVTNFVPITVTTDANCKSRVGGITGNLYNGSVTGCSNYGAITNNQTATGAAGFTAGIIGVLDGSSSSTVTATCEDCHNYATVLSTFAGTANFGVAGIVGQVTSTAYYPTVSNCTNEGEVYVDNETASVAHYVGGIIAIAASTCPDLTVDQCENKGAVHSNLNGNLWIGGIIGCDYSGTIQNSKNSGKVYFEQKNASGSGYVCIGGVCGQTYSSATITGCENSGAVTSDKLQVSRIGGIVGTHNASTVSDCTNSADITLSIGSTANNWEAVGGIAGFYDGSDGAAVVTGCTNTGKVTGEINSNNANIGAGGIAGIIKSGDATGNVNRGAVSMYNAQSGMTSYAGGIVGYDYNTASPQSQVTGNTNYGSVEATAAGSSTTLAAGGLVGRNDVGLVSTGANYGAVTCSLYAGSLLGWNVMDLTDSTAGGSVNGTTLTESNYESLAVGYNTGNVSGIVFGSGN